MNLLSVMKTIHIFHSRIQNRCWSGGFITNPFISSKLYLGLEIQPIMGTFDYKGIIELGEAIKVLGT